MADKNLDTARQLTAASIKELLEQKQSESLTQIDLSDVTELADDVARVLPAGNVVAIVLSQLSSIKGNRVSGDETRQMMSLLKQGMSTFLDRATYLTFYTTPAILISGYQALLEAAGKDPQSAFPDGTWQYYLEFGLREDRARHTCETSGFQKITKQELPVLSEADQLAAWVLSASWLLMIYEDLLLQEWHERTMLRRLADHIGELSIPAQWVNQRPYRVPNHSSVDYLAYRRASFQRFVLQILRTRGRDRKPDDTLDNWQEEETTLLQVSRVSYQDQMSILAHLSPQDFSDVRESIPLPECQIGVVFNNQYYLIPVAHNGHILDAVTVRALAQSIMSNDEKSGEGHTVDDFLINIPRQHQRVARKILTDQQQHELEVLRRAPIIINWDLASSSMNLSEIRQGKRGIGDHALTLFRTDKTMVFDQSHIFFDAIWGMAVAEIMTNHAISTARELSEHDSATVPGIYPPSLQLMASQKQNERLRQLINPQREVSAEIQVDVMSKFNRVRWLLSQRHEELQLTVNDLLVLYRSMYNEQYQPGQHLRDRLTELTGSRNRQQKKAAGEALEALKELPLTLPAFLIPMDATIHNPKDRIYPVTFRPQPPWTDIGFQHRETINWLLDYQRMTTPRAKGQTWEIFVEARTRYLEMLRMFNVLMLRYKEVALAGTSITTITLKILASVPKRLQSWLRHIPDKIDLLNDMLKGTEVFSNVGRVADDSSLTRFMTAKDDNEKKVLCWGIMTRADDVMVISLRDFRPWVTNIAASGAEDVAQLITQDYLEGFGEGLTEFLEQLERIVGATGT